MSDSLQRQRIVPVVKLCFAALACAFSSSAACADGSGPATLLAQTQRLDARPAPPEDSLEVRFWNSIKERDVAADFHTYLDAYPNGQFADLARARLRRIEGKSAPIQISPAETSPATQANSPGETVRDCAQCPALVPIPAGVFDMGSTEMFPFEQPVHQVTIRRPFLIGQREVSVAEWEACVADGACAKAPPSDGATRGPFPVTNVDWNDCQQYVAWLTKKTGRIYRLPSESEWEYAARGGGKTSYPWGAKMEPGRANCAGCNATATSGVVATGSYAANGFGLYDVAGNAAEWVEDCWNESYKSAPVDGSAWTKPRCQERVLRGGSFNNDPRYLRSASRFKYDYDVRYFSNGFRVARSQ
jgi:formylglycine-generating enzyme required for sulfatase activity